MRSIYPLSAALSVILIGLIGLLIERKEIKHGKIDQMDRKEVESRLRALLEKNDLGGNVVQDQGGGDDTLMIEHEDGEEYVVDFDEVEVEEGEVVEVEDLPSDLEHEAEEESDD